MQPAAYVFCYRIAFLFPLVFIGGGMYWGLGADASSLPDAAERYLNWQRAQPMQPVYWLLNRLGLVGLLGLVVSSIGLVLFRPYARYAYLMSVILAMAGNVVDIPILAQGLQFLLDDLAALSIGFNLCLIFFGPAASLFKRQRATLSTL